MKWNNKELSEYTKEELIDILEKLLCVVAFSDSTCPEDLRRDDLYEVVWINEK